MDVRVDEDPYLDIDEAAAFLRTTAKALRMQRYRGQGPPFVKPGAKLIIRMSRLVEWAESCTGSQG